MARAVFDDSRYFPVDRDSRLSDDTIDATLASLKGTIEESAEEKLDIDLTINSGLKRGGIFLPEMKDMIDEKMQIILLIDNGGYSMDPYINVVQKLFKKMKTRFAHDLKVFYFHNMVIFSTRHFFKSPHTCMLLSSAISLLSLEMRLQQHPHYHLCG